MQIFSNFKTKKSFRFLKREKNLGWAEVIWNTLNQEEEIIFFNIFCFFILVVIHSEKNVRKNWKKFLFLFENIFRFAKHEEHKRKFKQTIFSFEQFLSLRHALFKHDTHFKSCFEKLGKSKWFQIFQQETFFKLLLKSLPISLVWWTSFEVKFLQALRNKRIDLFQIKATISAIWNFSTGKKRLIKDF